MAVRHTPIFRFRPLDDSRSLSLFEKSCLAMMTFGGVLLAAVVLTDLYFRH